MWIYQRCQNYKEKIWRWSSVNKFNNEIDKDNKIIRTYEDESDENNIKNLLPGNIIISTNLTGKGTDIMLDGEIIKNGGLHVCLTFLPKNTRVKEQTFGRAGKKRWTRNLSIGS